MKYGYTSSHCNGVYYNPKTKYLPPVDATGTAYPNAVFTAAQYDGFNTATGSLSTTTGKGTVDLSAAFKSDMFVPYSANSTYSSYGGLDDTAQPAYYYTYSGTQSSEAQKNYYDTNSVFYKECNSVVGSTSQVDGSHAVNTLFTKVIVSATSGPDATARDERQNFANWFSYYRTRMLMMKSATGLAFSRLDNHYRVGFATMNNNSVDDHYVVSSGNGTNFVNLATFDNTGKAAWYAKLYGAIAYSGTPLLNALSKAGLLYGGKLSTLNTVTVTDPIQYSCQQNFTILCTDGFWNDQTNQKLTGSASTTAVGQQDGNENPPYWDGQTTTYTKSTSQRTQTQTQYMQSTSQVKSRTTQLQSRTNLLTRQTYPLTRTQFDLQRSTSDLQSKTDWLTSSTLTLQTCTGKTSGNNPCSASGSGWVNSTSSSCTPNSNTNVNCRYVAGTETVVPFGTNCTGYATAPTSNFNAQTKTLCSLNPQSLPTPVWVAANSCTTQTQLSNAIGQQTFRAGRACQYTSWSTPQSAGSSCTPVAQTYALPQAVTCSYAATATTTNLSTCTAVGQSTTGTYAGPAFTCTYATTPTTDTVDTCTQVGQSTANNYSGPAIGCSYAGWSGWGGVNSCTSLGPSSGPTNYTVGTATECNPTDTGWVNSSSCAAANPTSGNSYATTACNTVTTGPTPIASCTVGTTTNGTGLTTTCVKNISGPTPVQSCTAGTDANYVATTCNTVTTSNTVASCTAQSATADTSWTSTSCSAPILNGGMSNTLADVAEYYYQTDLRTSNCTGALGAGTDVCYNNVLSSGEDSASWQHMTTFTLGLGTRGRMVFSPTYKKDLSGDYFSVKNMLSANPPNVCSWKSSGTTCVWPTPDVNGAPENIDDLWHAAVNGRGTFFSATDPSSLSVGMSGALNSMKASPGSSAAATTSNPTVTTGDNFVFSSLFTTNSWIGELIRQQIDVANGTLPSDATTFDWAAQALLDANSTRTIYTSNGAAPWSRLEFTADNFKDSAAFKTPNISGLTQFCSTGVSTCLSSDVQTSPTGASGANLVNYLRGDTSHEGAVDPATPAAYYRNRAAVLGDMVNSEAVYVKGSLLQYTDLGYKAFTNGTPTTTGTATRQPMVYIGANDGMLHAFYATNAASGAVGGSEAWAYIPSMVMPNLYKLADQSYATGHQYFVDGTPVVSDICSSQCGNEASAVWKTILVGGLNGGGRGYYALDVTNPASPNVLWEFTNDNLGYTYGNPIITKLNNGTWVVMVASGYNNVSPGDGQGHLFILNADTGALIRDIATGVGTTTAPSGLARINAWVNNSLLDNTAVRAYGGDLEGNLWRFTIDAAGASGAGVYGVQRLVALKDASGNGQPITARPELGKVGTTVVVYVGTGKFLGTTDLSNTQQQSFYGVKDTLATPSAGAPVWANPRTITCTVGTTANCFVKQPLSNATTCPSGSSICPVGWAARTITSPNPVDFGSQAGWYVDLPDTGERANTDPALSSGVVVFTTNTPSESTCTVGGYSYIYMLNYLSGAAVNTTTNGVIAVKLGNVYATRSALVVLASNRNIAITRLSNGTTVVSNLPPPIQSGAGSGAARRVSWHELLP
ncbi:PilC/PilY family type IV pilus protein [uncultured Thiodictyon sp.]|uniref:PilC/PilY family type IV pilus protein n=1 Tax=uncultured Thiodictyon sp. TaxID=1846217 RepID=UPI0025E4AAD3|nr:PilC/PilY family type IV pilus protein [uncultured Thiodictyon sp.]